MACIMENTAKGFTGRNTHILFASQAAIKALHNFQINSTLVWDCHKSLLKLAEQDRIQVEWRLGHMRISENKSHDQLTRQGSSHPLTGRKPALGISAKVSWGVIRG
jgi:hypothetical protein